MQSDINTKPLKINLLFQLRSSNVEINQKNIYIPNSLWKQQRLQLASPILINSSDQYYLFFAWPYKSTSNSNDCLLHKCWQTNFKPQDKFYLLPFDSLRSKVFPCSSVLFRINSEYSLKPDLILHLTSTVKSLFNGVFISKNMKFQFLFKGKFINIEVFSASSDLQGFESDFLSFYKIDENSNVSIFAQVSSLNIDMTQKENIKNLIGGYQHQIDQFLYYLTFGLFQSHFPTYLFSRPKGLLVYGPSGSGKSFFVKTILNLLKITFVEIDQSILFKKELIDVEVELNNLFKIAERQQPCVLLVENLELLCPRRDSSFSTDISKALVTAWLKLVDNIHLHSKVLVIAISSNFIDIDPAMRRNGRIDKEIELNVPNFDERYQIIKSILFRLNLNSNTKFEFIFSDFNISHLSNLTNGLVPSDLVHFVKELIYSFFSCYENHFNLFTVETIEEKKLVTFTNDAIDSIVKLVSPNSLREISIEVPNTRWHDIGGMETIKQSLKLIFNPFISSVSFCNSYIKGVLLYGPPGCSKTLLAKAIATESSMNFLAVRGPELLSKWLGESEKAIQSLFKKARQSAPTIIFFDEIDALAGKRGESSAGVSDRILSQLLSELDGINSSNRIIVIAATNRPDLLDKALIRPGRFDVKIYVPPPDFDSRVSILRNELNKSDNINNINFMEIVKSTENFSGAELVALCNEAILSAVENGRSMLREQDFIEAFQNIKPQITLETIKFYEDYKALNYI